MIIVTFSPLQPPDPKSHISNPGALSLEAQGFGRVKSWTGLTPQTLNHHAIFAVQVLVLGFGHQSSGGIWSRSGRISDQHILDPTASGSRLFRYAGSGWGAGVVRAQEQLHLCH